MKWHRVIWRTSVWNNFYKVRRIIGDLKAKYYPAPTWLFDSVVVILTALLKIVLVNDKVKVNKKRLYSFHLQAYGWRFLLVLTVSIVHAITLTYDATSLCLVNVFSPLIIVFEMSSVKKTPQGNLFSQFSVNVSHKIIRIKILKLDGFSIIIRSICSLWLN